MTPLMAIVYRWRDQRLEFANRRESQLPLALKLGWTLLAKDSDVFLTDDAAHGEHQQD